MINIKERLKNLIGRDSKGKFVSPKVTILKGIWTLVGIMAVIYVLELQVIQVVLYWRTRELQKPIVIMVGDTAKQYNDTVFSVITRPFIIDLPPMKILRPVLAFDEPVAVETPKLTDIEQKIFDKFGEKNYNTFKALAICESCGGNKTTGECGKNNGLNPNAVNWVSKDLGLLQINWPIWEKPVFEKFGYTLGDMFDVDKNIEVSHWIFDRDGDGEGSIEPWVASRTACFAREVIK